MAKAIQDDLLDEDDDAVLNIFMAAPGVDMPMRQRGSRDTDPSVSLSDIDIGAGPLKDLRDDRDAPPPRFTLSVTPADDDGQDTKTKTNIEKLYESQTIYTGETDRLQSDGAPAAVDDSKSKKKKRQTVGDMINNALQESAQDDHDHDSGDADPEAVPHTSVRFTLSVKQPDAGEDIDLPAIA